jgi:hypothetical protein
MLCFVCAENLKIRDLLEDLDVDGEKVLKYKKK